MRAGHSQASPLCWKFDMPAALLAGTLDVFWFGHVWRIRQCKGHRPNSDEVYSRKMHSTLAHRGRMDISETAGLSLRIIGVGWVPQQGDPTVASFLGGKGG